MNWRLLVSVSALITEIGGEKVVYLTSTGKKEDVEVLKQLKKQGYSYNTVVIDDPKFKVKLVNHNSDIFIAINIADNWYRVMNFNTYHLASIIEQCDIVKGEITSGEFEPIYNKNEAALISFVSPCMKEYKAYFNEMTRVLNCELYSKTKKVTIGHRYDSLTETRYYIGKVNARKSDNTSSGFENDDLLVTPVYLYVNDLNDTDKTVDDIFKTRTFGSGENCIKVEFSKVLPSMVDSGVAIDTTCESDISKYWEVMLKNAIDSCKVVTKEGYEYYEKYECILDLFSYQTTNFGYSISPSMKLDLENCIEKICKHNLLMQWDKLSYRADLMIGKGKTSEENKEALVKLFYENLGSGNVMRNLYYGELLKKLGINIKQIASDVLKYWDIDSEIYADFDTYYKHLFYIRRNRLHEDIADFTAKSGKTLKDLYVDSYLRNIILELVNEAKNNCGIGINDYKIVDGFTTRYIITIEDIIHHCGGILSEELKKDIVNYKFNRLTILAKEDKTIE